MELTSKQQTTEQIKAAQKILVLTHVNPDGDGLGSLLACYLVLKKLGKDVTAVAPETLPMALKFLPNTKDLVTNYNSTKDFIISIDTRAPTIISSISPPPKLVFIAFLSPITLRL